MQLCFKETSDLPLHYNLTVAVCSFALILHSLSRNIRNRRACRTSSTEESIVYVDVDTTEFDACMVSIYDYAGQVRLLANVSSLLLLKFKCHDPRLVEKLGALIQEGRLELIRLKFFGEVSRASCLDVLHASRTGYFGYPMPEVNLSLQRSQIRTVASACGINHNRSHWHFVNLTITTQGCIKVTGWHDDGVTLPFAVAEHRASLTTHLEDGIIRGVYGVAS